MPTNVIMPALELAQIHMLRRNEFAPLRTGMGHLETKTDVISTGSRWSPVAPIASAIQQRPDGAA
jgi:hypothetical protein